MKTQGQQRNREVDRNLTDSINAEADEVVNNSTSDALNTQAEPAGIISTEKKRRVGRPAQEKTIDNSIDRRVLTYLMDNAGLSIADLGNLLMVYCNHILREDPSYADKMLDSDSFPHFFKDKTNFPADLFTKLLGIMGYQMIITPVEATIKVEFNDTVVEIPPNIKKDSIKLITLKQTAQHFITEDAAIRYIPRMGLERFDIDLPRKINIRTRKSKKTSKQT